jgi:hypothetical protein
MTAITIQTTLLDCGEGRVVLANDGQARPLVGVSMQRPTDAAPIFVQIDRVTMFDLERGAVDLRTVLAERCAGVTIGA